MIHEMIRTTVFITDQQSERLRQKQQETGLVVAEHIRRAIDVYLDLEDLNERIRKLEEQLAWLVEIHTPDK